MTDDRLEILDVETCHGASPNRRETKSHNDMKKSIVLIICLFALLGLQSCHKKANTAQTVEPVVLNEQTVSAFARNIANGIVGENADVLNNAFDAEGMRQLVSENPIVYSGFDVEGGKEYFEKCLHLGEQAVKAVHDGGDFAFVKYYLQNQQHHIVFRSYNDFNLNFMDFIVDTVQGELKIKDGFIFNTGALLSKNIEYSMLFNLMLQTNPNDEAHWLQTAQELTLNGQHTQALRILTEHKEGLREYPLYYQLWIANLYQSNPKTFIAQLDKLKDDVDERYLLLHKFLCFFNEGRINETEEVVTRLIPFTGDDPIYLLFYGKACLLAKDYPRALDCFATAESALPLLWDLWYSEIQCYRGMKDTKGIEQCLLRGKDAYGMSDEELDALRKELWD